MAERPGLRLLQELGLDPAAAAEPQREPTRLEYQPTPQPAPDIQVPGGPTLGGNGRAGLTENQRRAQQGLPPLEDAGRVNNTQIAAQEAELAALAAQRQRAIENERQAKGIEGPGPRFIRSLELRPPGSDERRG